MKNGLTFSLSLVAVLLVPGCGGGATNTAEQASENDSGPSLATAAACPSSDFHDFFQRFSEDPAIQAAFTAKPLQMDSLDANAEPEPRLVTNMVSDVSFPVLPGEEDRKREGLVVSVESVSADQAIIKLAKPDTDYQVLYHFKRGDCWTLYRKEDESI